VTIRPLSAERGCILQLRGVSKRFGEKAALTNVDLDVESGEVHVVCGENGAGKSTLMSIVAGILRPDEGEILIDGRPARFADPIDAARAGIGMVHQHFMLIPSMSVAENLYLNRQPYRWGCFSDRAAMRAGAEALIRRHRFELDPDAEVSRLSVGQRQRVEILKALGFEARLLILDEPTAVLTPPEVAELLAIMGQLKAAGRTILFITHKLSEVKAVADRVTVLRHGERISTRPARDLSESAIALDMVGREMRPPHRRTVARAEAGPVLAFAAVTMTTASGRRTLDGVNLTVAAGEILGVAGVDGNGQTELTEAAAGLATIQTGAILLEGRDVTGLSVAARRKAGVAFIPEDRLDRGLSATMSVSENLCAGLYRRKGLVGAAGLLRMPAVNAFVSAAIRRFDVRGASPALAVGQLSGGNMQKIVIAREMEKEPAALIVAQPTRGLDIGATEFVHGQILAAADAGCAVLLVSSELTEIFALSDRIAVMFRGRLSGIVERSQATEESIGLMMSGAGLEAAA
jgi:general nucleoside transport system ATP-binding protein